MIDVVLGHQWPWWPEMSDEAPSCSESAAATLVPVQYIPHVAPWPHEEAAIWQFADALRAQLGVTNRNDPVPSTAGPVGRRAVAMAMYAAAYLTAMRHILDAERTHGERCEASAAAATLRRYGYVRGHSLRCALHLHEPNDDLCIVPVPRDLTLGAFVRIRPGLVRATSWWHRAGPLAIGVLIGMEGSPGDENRAARVKILFRGNATTWRARIPDVVRCPPLLIGAYVRVARWVRQPHFGWGCIGRQDVGRFLGVNRHGDAIVDMFRVGRWRCIFTELELCAHPFRPGDLIVFEPPSGMPMAVAPNARAPPGEGQIVVVCSTSFDNTGICVVHYKLCGEVWAEGSEEAVEYAAWAGEFVFTGFSIGGFVKSRVANEERSHSVRAQGKCAETGPSESQIRPVSPVDACIERVGVIISLMHLLGVVQVAFLGADDGLVLETCDLSDLEPLPGVASTALTVDGVQWGIWPVDDDGRLLHVSPPDDMGTHEVMQKVPGVHVNHCPFTGDPILVMPADLLGHEEPRTHVVPPLNYSQHVDTRWNMVVAQRRSLDPRIARGDIGYMVSPPNGALVLVKFFGVTNIVTVPIDDLRPILPSLSAVSWISATSLRDMEQLFCGAAVRVRPMVRVPRYGWGSSKVSHAVIGRVGDIVAGRVYVLFDGRTSFWVARITEVERVDPPSQPPKHCRVGSVVTFQSGLNTNWGRCGSRDVGRVVSYNCESASVEVLVEGIGTVEAFPWQICDTSLRRRRVVTDVNMVKAVRIAPYLDRYLVRGRIYRDFLFACVTLVSNACVHLRHGGREFGSVRPTDVIEASYCFVTGMYVSIWTDGHVPPGGVRRVVAQVVGPGSDPSHVKVRFPHKKGETTMSIVLMEPLGMTAPSSLADAIAGDEYTSEIPEGCGKVWQLHADWHEWLSPIIGIPVVDGVPDTAWLPSAYTDWPQHLITLEDVYDRPDTYAYVTLKAGLHVVFEVDGQLVQGRVVLVREQGTPMSHLVDVELPGARMTLQIHDSRLFPVRWTKHFDSAFDHGYDWLDIGGHVSVRNDAWQAVDVTPWIRPTDYDPMSIIGVRCLSGDSLSSLRLAMSTDPDNCHEVLTVRSFSRAEWDKDQDGSAGRGRWGRLACAHLL